MRALSLKIATSGRPNRAMICHQPHPHSGSEKYYAGARNPRLLNYDAFLSGHIKSTGLRRGFRVLHWRPCLRPPLSLSSAFALLRASIVFSARPFSPMPPMLLAGQTSTMLLVFPPTTLRPCCSQLFITCFDIHVTNVHHKGYAGR